MPSESAVPDPRHPGPGFAAACGEAWTAGDGSALATLYAPGAEYLDTGTGARARGPEGILRIAADMLAFAPDSRVVFDAARGDGAHLAATWTWSGSACGPLLLDGVRHPPTGRAFSIDGVAVLDVDPAGAITVHHDFYDMRTVMRACALGEFAARAARPLVERAYIALAAGDRDALEDLIAEDFDAELCEGMPLGLGGRRTGATAMIDEGWWAIGRAFAVRAEPEEWIAGADGRLLVRGRYRGTSRDGGGVVDAAFDHLWSARDGQLASLRQLTDTVRWGPA